MWPCSQGPLLLLLWPLLASAGQIKKDSWHPVRVLTSLLTSGNYSSHNIETNVQCAHLALRTPWCYLYVFSNNNCTLSTVEVEALVEHTGDTVKAWTRIKPGKNYLVLELVAL